MPCYTEGDYQSVLRAKQKPKLSLGKSYQMFLLDFYPYDKYEFKKLYGFEDDEEDEWGDNGWDDKDNDNLSQQSSNESTQGYIYDDDDSDDWGGHSKKFRRRKSKRREEDDEPDPDRADFIVRVFGLIQINDKYYSASVDLTNFQPFFYIKVPEHWSNYHLDQLITQLRSEAHFTFADHLVKWRLVKRKPFYYFTGDDQFQYAELTFSSLFAFHKYSWILMKGVKGKTYPRLESNIEPMLRLIHIQNITPSGWIEIPAEKFIQPIQRTSDCQVHLKIKYHHIRSLPDKIDIPPLEYASYDIEADSSHGDFPVGQKDYQKLAQDFITEFLKLPAYQRQEFYLRNLLRTWLGLAFHDYYYNNNINQIHTENNQKPTLNQIEELIPYVWEYGQHTHRLISDFEQRFKTDMKNSDPEATNRSAPTETDQTRLQQELRDLQTRLHHLLEVSLPPLDLTNKHRTSHYGLLAEQLLKEVHRALQTNNRQFQKDPQGCLRFWLQLAFDDYYNNHNIHWIETKKNRKPKAHVLDNLVPQIYWICTQCYEGLGLKLSTAPGSSGKRPSKAKPPPLYKKAKPPSRTQTKLSSFFKVEKAEPDKKKEELVGPQDELDEQEEELAVFFRGRLKKTLPEKPKRDFYVEWLRDLFNQFLPSVEGDPIIQIGTTYKRYGEKELFLKHIIVLDTFVPFTSEDVINDENKGVSMKIKDAQKEAQKLQIENPSSDLATLNKQIQIARRELQKNHDHSVLRIESYATEREVLLAWQKLIKLTDPDIVIGYNIFGFDFKYLWERAEELDCVEQFRDLGRVHKYPHELKEHKLSSSGLGENILTYIPMTGRVIIDLFKVIQTGGYRLPFYKLDYVCQVFLSKQKNDLPPQQIFIMQKGSAVDRSTIARYCLVDCILCNRLIDRLEIITNNIGMSQVCTVPLSYLFLRGQGIKILSLVSKICRQEGYLIKTKEKVDDPEKFEGAIVLTPKKGIYFEPCVVADFNSLYPSCMIAENLSHDSYVEIGGKYDNLPGCEYVDILYDLYEERPIPGRKKTEKVKCGVKTCRYYQPPDGKKSLLPRILMQLLKARKDTRVEQKQYPKGSFKWNVKEGMQLAYKVTANSLYGQVGAKTSPIFLKDIAACTTSCGRTLIYKTKEFFEENYESSTAVYGDSVTGDTPVLVRSPDGTVDVKTIDNLVTDDAWESYEEFKPWDTNRKEKLQALTDWQCWTSQGWSSIRRVIRHRTKKQLYRVKTRQGSVDVTEDHSLLTKEGEIIKPTEAINSELLHTFPKLSISELSDSIASICRTGSPKSIWCIKHDQGIIIESDNKLEIQLFYCFLKAHGFKNLMVRHHTEYPRCPYRKKEKYWVEYGYEEHDQNYRVTKIEKLRQVDQNQFVYDLETSVGNFQAGVGCICLKNTDSIFMKFNAKNSRGEKLQGLDAVYKSIELCTEGSLSISRGLKKPHNLEFEKAIFPFMLLSKKRYHGHYYTDYGSPNYFAKSMGIVLKRRDNAEIVKTVFGGTLDVIMKEHDLEKAKEFCRQACRQVLRGEYPMEKFILTKTLRSYYKTPDQIAHNVLAQRIGERDPGNKPKSNDRIAYAYVKVPEPRKGEKILQGDRIETPEYIREHNLALDYKFYLTNQIMKPVSQIFELDDSQNLSDLFLEALMEYDRAQSGMSKISAWVAPDSAEFKKRVDALLRSLLAEEDLDKDPDYKMVEEMYE